MLNDNFFKKVEQKTKVSKETIMNLAAKLQQNNLKDEVTLKEIIHELSHLTGRELTSEQQDNIIKAVLTDQVPKDLNELIPKD